MVVLGRTLFGVQIGFLALAGILIGCSFGGFLGSGYMITSAVLVILLWGTFAGLMVNAVRLAVGLTNETSDLTETLTWANRLFLTLMILAPVTGLGLAFLSFVGCGPLWIPGLYHWSAMIGTILSFAVFFLLPWFVRRCVGETDYPACHHWAMDVFMPLGVVVVWGLAWLIPYLMLKGDITLSDYSAKNRVYQLPFPGGDGSWVIQGNNSGFNHNDSDLGQKFAWDFRRECGTPVLAARKGTIKTAPDDTHDGIGGTNNQITVDHGDGTVAFYLHIQKGSATARLRTIGAVVNQGDQIAEVGCVGNSLTGHIHFMVRPTSTTTMGVSFTDVSDDNGIPRTFGSYKSGNRRVP
jgi:hypothetical protein